MRMRVWFGVPQSLSHVPQSNHADHPPSTVKERHYRLTRVKLYFYSVIKLSIHSVSFAGGRGGGLACGGGGGGTYLRRRPGCISHDELSRTAAACNCVPRADRSAHKFVVVSCFHFRSFCCIWSKASTRRVSHRSLRPTTVG